MAYHLDKQDENAIVFNGHEQGIANSPYEGISDMRNLNIISIPGEASVGFSTVSNVFSNVSGTVISADAGADTVTLNSNSVQTGQAIVFAGGSLPSGVSAGTIYWAGYIGGNTYQLYTDFFLVGSVVNIGGTGTGTYSTVIMGQPKYFNHFVTPYIDTYFIVDANGRVWGLDPNALVKNWRYTGNSIAGGTTHGNGLVSYIPSDVGSTANGYLFVFRDYQIDYATINSNTGIAWTYGWDPSDGTATHTNYLKCYSTGSNNSLIHESIVGPDNKVYYCDANWIGRWYQANPNVGFLPATPSTYVFDQTAVLPFNDAAQCLAPSGNNVLIGGRQNVVYPWDTFDQLPNFPIFVAENNIVKMVTVNTNTYILAGNRGRIYVTNGSQAQLYKKLPDHLSGTVEPYYVWGGLSSNKNQLYFSAQVFTNANVATSTMGGLWAIDLKTEAMRLVNELSYGTYAGYATAIIPNFSSAPAGSGLYIGWDSGSSTYGVDTTSSTPYTSSQAYIDYDLIPMATLLRAKTFKTVEYKLSVPMVTNESVSIYYRLNFNDAYTLIFTSSGVTSNGSISDNSPVNFENAQWIQLRAVTNSTASSPSFTRLTEIRIK